MHTLYDIGYSIIPVQFGADGGIKYGIIIIHDDWPRLITIV